MSLLDTLLAAFAPHACLGCESEGRLICEDCAIRLRPVAERCYRCKKLSTANRTCQSCRHASKLHTVQAATVYEGLAKDVVWRVKFHGAQAAAKEMAKRMVPLVADNKFVLCHVPTASSRIRQRGYDQARLLTRALAKETGLPCHALLMRIGQHHQVGARREQRVTQLASAFRTSGGTDLIKDAHILLIDDVLTTGATLEAASRMLKAAGAKRIDALVFAQT